MGMFDDIVPQTPSRKPGMFDDIAPKPGMFDDIEVQTPTARDIPPATLEQAISGVKVGDYGSLAQAAASYPPEGPTDAELQNIWSAPEPTTAPVKPQTSMITGEGEQPVTQRPQGWGKEIHNALERGGLRQIAS